MILRSITKHVKEQNWFAVVLDLVIVVFGVVIGIQVSNWNDAEAEKRKGIAYQERLIEDLKKDFKYKQQLIMYFDAIYESAEKTNSLLSETSPDALSLIINAYRATELAAAPIPRSTWDEILTSGDIELLPNKAFTGSISSYYEWSKVLRISNSLSKSDYRHRVRQILPHEIQKALRVNCGEIFQGSVPMGFTQNCKLNLPEEEITQAAQLLLADPAVLGFLRYQFSLLNNIRVMLNAQAKVIQNFIQGLAQTES